MKKKVKKKFIFLKTRFKSEDSVKSNKGFKFILDLRSPFMFPSVDIGYYLKSINVNPYKKRKNVEVNNTKKSEIDL
ncbi:MAG: hypothetical protein HWN81_11465 [Candidatus Lokiarchaeota archaeon]|nr:hypothetical protein [Candidatus Lokiarchaeota archaeon]